MPRTNKHHTSSTLLINYRVHILVILATAIILIFLIHIILATLQFSTHIKTYPTNGTFQLFNPLKRMGMGQILGHDFPFFHGIGVPLLHYPVFAIFGQSIFAAELTKFVTSCGWFIFSTCLFFYAATKRDWRQTIVMTALFTGVCLAALPIVFPGNSLLGLRSTFPVLVAAVMLLPFANKFSVRSLSISYKTMVIIFLLACSFFVGSEQGLVACTVYFLIRAVGYKTFSKKGFVFGAAKTGFLAVCLAILIFLLANIFSTGHGFEVLHYALIDIPKDQGWYFGASPNNYLTFSNFLPELIGTKSMIKIGLVILFSLLFILIGIRSKLFRAYEYPVLCFLMGSTLLVFIAGSVGYYAPNPQLAPFARAAALFATLIIVRLLFIYAQAERPKKPAGWMRSLPKLSLYIFCSILVTLGLLQSYTKLRTYNPVDSFNKFIHAPGKDTNYVLNPQWKKRLASFSPSLDAKEPLWSMYTGLYDDELGQLNTSPGGEDYIIHALGKQRRDAYTKKFLSTKPSQVVTVKPSFFQYEEWLWSRHWPIYRELFTKYQITDENSAHLLWKPQVSDAPSTVPIQFSEESHIANKYVLPDNNSGTPKLYEIKISYSAGSGLFRSVLSQVPRYLVTIQSQAMRETVSLPSYEKEWTFPVIVMPGEKGVALSSSTDGILPTAQLAVEKMSYEPLTIPASNTYALIANYCKLPKREFRTSDSRCSEINLRLKNYRIRN